MMHGATNIKKMLMCPCLFIYSCRRCHYIAVKPLIRIHIHSTVIRRMTGE